MALSFLVRFPDEDCDCALAIMNPHNISPEIADALYRLYCRYNDEGGLISNVPYVPNKVYQFIHVRSDDAVGQGLVFRPFDSGLDGDEPAVEFYVPEQYRMQRDRLLLALPALLAHVGIRDDDALFALGAKISSHVLTPNGVMAQTILDLLRQLACGSPRYRAALESIVIPAVAKLPPTHSVHGDFFRGKSVPEFEHLSRLFNTTNDRLSVIIDANEDIAKFNLAQGNREPLLTTHVRHWLGYAIGAGIPLERWRKDH